jgi:carboxyl-terminal processing protease
MRQFTKIAVVFALAFLGMATKADHSRNGKYFEISKNIEIFTNLYKEINTYYVDDLDPAKLMRTGVDAMLESLDPYTNYISESEIEGFRYITEGKYNGIGAIIKRVGDYITIIEPYDNCPAQKAGLKAGDVIKAIDGKSAKGKKSDDIMDFLKGFPGTEVVLTIQRPGPEGDMDISLTRDEVKVPNVPYLSMVSDDIGYLTLTTFTRDAGKNVGDALKKLKKENPNLKGIIFDLRGNGGGLLTEAVNVSNVFIPKGEMVVSTKGKVVDWDRSFKTLNRPVDAEIPLAILINKGSASASEIVSGVLQDLDRGVLVGQRSYGKGLVQNTRDVGYNSRVKMTTAKYYIPSGRCIQGVSYKDGEPVNIPDSLRAEFITRNGRKVLDGGGVKPDLALESPSDVSIIKSLLKENAISFIKFLSDTNFEYETLSEKMMKAWIKQAEKEKLLASIESDIASMKAKIKKEKKNDLEQHQEAIINEIEREIVSRYYYQKGKIQMGLKNDQEIKDAISILRDQKRYNDLLKNK